MKKFDIVANLPPELLYNVCDWLTECQVVQLYRVSKTWGKRLDGLRWKDKVQHFSRFGYDIAPGQNQFPRLSESLIYLDISADRLEFGSNLRLAQMCFALKTLIIRDVCLAPLDGVLILADSRLQSLSLVRMTFAHTRWWLPYLSGCPQLKLLKLSVDMGEACSSPRLRSNTHSSRPQGIIQSLHTLLIELNTPWAPAIGSEGSSKLKRGRAMLCGALMQLRAHAPKLNTFQASVIHNRRERPLDSSFLQQFVGDPSSKKAFKTLSLNGLRCEADSLTMCNKLTLRNVTFTFSGAQYLPINWIPFWTSEHLKSLEVVYNEVECPCEPRKLLSLGRNLQYLKLLDPEGLLANNLFYTMREGRAITLPSLQFLSLFSLRNWIRLSSGSDTPASSDRVIEDDLVRLAEHFPNLVDVELVEVIDVPEAAARATLEPRLPDLKFLVIISE